MTKKPPIFPALTTDDSVVFTDVDLNTFLTGQTLSLDNIHSYPELLTLLFLSGDSYNNQPIKNLPKNWKRFWSVKSSASGFFAAIYGNERAKQIVLAIRGTKFSNFGALRADGAILRGAISSQMNSAATCIKKLKKKMKSLFPGWALIITGHSLGSYLADITTFSGMYLTYDESTKAFCKRDGDVEESIEVFPYTVGFDGPGSLQMLIKLRDSMDVRYGTGSRMRVEDLPADHYVGVPNSINTVNRQVGGVYQISMDFSKCKGIPIVGGIIKFLDNLVGKVPTHFLGNFISALEGNAVALNAGNVVLNTDGVASDENAESLDVNFEASNRSAEALTQKVFDWPSNKKELTKVNFCSTTDSRKPEVTEGPYARNRYQVEPSNHQEVELRYFSKPVQRFLHRIEIVKCYTMELDFLLENVPKREKDLIVAKLKSIRVNAERKLVICSDEGMSKLTLIPWLNALHILHPKLIEEENFIYSLYGQLSIRQTLLQFKSDPLGLQIETLSTSTPKQVFARDTSISREEILASLDLQKKTCLVLKTSQYTLLGKLFDIKKVKQKVDVVVFEKDTEIFDPPENVKVIIIHHDEAAPIVKCKVDNLTDECKKRLLSSPIDFQGTEVTLNSFVRKINDDILPFLLEGRIQKITKFQELPPSKLYFERTLVCRKGIHRFMKCNNIAPMIAVNESSIIVLSDGSGAGKSTLLTKLCIDLKTENKYLWVIRVNLNDRTQIITRCAEEIINSDGSDPVELLTDLVSYDPCLTALLRSVLKDEYSQVEIMLFLDALDECNPKNDQLVIKLVQQLRYVRKIKKILITTRPHLEFKLRNHLISPADEMMYIDEESSMEEKWWLNENWVLLPLNMFSLCPFSEAEQVKIINKIMLNCNEGTIVPNVEILLRKLSIPPTATGTPMMLELLAKEFINVDENSVVNLSMHSIYENYIKRKILEFVREKEGWTEDSRYNNQETYLTRYLEFYFYYAAKETLQINDCELKNYRLYEPTEAEKNVLLSHGLVTGTEFFFEHRSFAEFFFAKWLMSEKWRRQTDLSKLFVDILTSQEYENVRMFMDGEAEHHFITDEQKTLFENIAEQLLHIDNEIFFSNRPRLFQHVADGLRKFCNDSTLQRILLTQIDITLLKIHDSETVDEWEDYGICPSFMSQLLKCTEEDNNILYRVNLKMEPQLQSKIFLLLEKHLEKQEIKELIVAKNSAGNNALFSIIQHATLTNNESFLPEEAFELHKKGQTCFEAAFEWQMKFLTDKQLIDVIQTNNQRSTNAWLTYPYLIHKFLETRKPAVLDKLENIFETEKQCIWLSMSGNNLEYVYEEMFVPQYRGRLEKAFTSQVLHNTPGRISPLSLAASRVHSSQLVALLELAIRSGVSPTTLDDHEIWDRIECTKGLDKLFTFCVRVKLTKGVKKILDMARLTKCVHRTISCDYHIYIANDKVTIDEDRTRLSMASMA